MLVGLIIILLILAYFSYLAYYKTKVAKNLDELLQQDVLVLDVRTEREFNANHLQKAINIPVGSLSRNLSKLDTSTTIITCCSHGIRSVRALNILEKNGFKNVYNGGAWKQLKPLIN